MTKNRKKIISKVIASGMLISNIPIQTFANEIEDVILDTSNIEENINNEDINNSDIEDKTEIIDSNELKNEIIISEGNSLNNSQLIEEDLKIEDTISLDTKDVEKETTTEEVESNKYIINTLDDLKQLRIEINDNNVETTNMIVELTSDIDFSTENKWIAIGTDENKFSGVFNGNGYSLKNLNIVGSDFEGIFSKSNNATFKNLNIENFSVTNSKAIFVGTLMGISYGNTNFESITLSNIEINNSGSYVGGLIGANVSNIVNISDIKGQNIRLNSETGSYVGGLIGSGVSNFQDIEASVEIISLESYCGGLVGSDGYLYSESKPLAFKNINIDVKLEGKRIGGIIGNASYNSVDFDGISITGEYLKSSKESGGIIGYSAQDDILKNIYVNIETISGEKAGGITAYKSLGKSNLDNIEINAMITAESMAGGVIGYNSTSGDTIGNNIKIEGTTIESNGYSAGVSAYNNSNSLLSELDVDINVSGKDSSGGIFGMTTNPISLENSKIKAILDTTNYAGGLIGYSMTNFNSINNSLDINIIDGKMSGGIVGNASGFNKSDILDNYIFVSINHGKDNVGGLIGSTYSNTFNISNNQIYCNLTGGNAVGGIFGTGMDNVIKNNKIIGTINGKENIGGIAGNLYGSGINLLSQNHIQVNLTGENYVGGIAGNSTMLKSENNLILGEIKGNTKVGGIVGKLSSSNVNVVIKSTIIASEIISDKPEILFGEYSNSGTLNLENIYYDNELTNVDNDYAIGLNTHSLQGKEAQNNMNLDFANVWKLNKEYYPTFEQLNTAPEIILNSDIKDNTIVINQYDKFDISKYITTDDFEGDEVTVTIKMAKENFDTSKYGIFPITLVATDSKGLSSELDLNLKINPVMVVINEVPIIIAEDITLTVGDKFNPSKVIIAVDKEDGIITNNVKILENTVDMTKPGVYKVIYEITDNAGAKATKTITVTVNAKEAVSDNNSSSNNDNISTGNNNNNSSSSNTESENTTIEKPQTGDTGFISIMTALMSVTSLYSINRRKEK